MIFTLDGLRLVFVAHMKLSARMSPEPEPGGDPHFLFGRRRMQLAHFEHSHETECTIKEEGTVDSSSWHTHGSTPV